MDIPKARLLPRQGPGKNKGLALVGSTVYYGGILMVCVAKDNLLAVRVYLDIESRKHWVNR